MKKLYAQVSYTFNNFYNNLNIQGQIVFTIIILLIAILLIMLFITYVIQKINSKKNIKKLKNDIKHEVKVEKAELEKNENQANEVRDIAKRVEDALNDDSPVSLTSFEEDQERTAIISIDELMQRAKELSLIDDEETGVNYLEKYNLEPATVEDAVNKTMNTSKKEVKAFKVSQVISPIYGIKKDAIEKKD